MPPVRPLLSRAASACSFALLAACSSLPTIAPDTAEAAGTDHVRIDGTHGPLSPDAQKRVLARLQAAGQDTDIFERHLAYEQEIVGAPLIAGNKVTLLQDGPQTYQALYAAMAGARSSIDMESYIIEDDEVGQRFAKELVAAHDRGVVVNLIYDSVGSSGTPRAYFDQLKAHGVNVLEFNPIDPLHARTGWDINNRDHRKLTVIDGRTAFVGGINISSVYSGGSFRESSKDRPGQSVPWRDTDVQIDGPAAADFQRLFMDTWSRQKGKPLVPADYYPQIARQGALLHAKTTLIDGVWTAVGSTNLDWRSFLHNDEVDAIVLSAGFGDQMKASFEQDLAQSEPLTLDQWEHRPLKQRVQEMATGMWEYWL